METEKIEILSHAGEAFLRTSSDAVFSYPMHAHTYYELTLYAPFSGKLTVNGVQILPTQPLVVLMTPTDLHRITVDGKTDAHFFKVEFDAQSCRGFPLPQQAIRLLLAPQEQLLPQLFFALQKASLSQTLYRQSLLHTILCRVCTEGHPLSGIPQPKGHALVARALQYLNAHFTEEISLRTLAQVCNVSSQYLSGCFSREVGLSYERYLCRLRLRNAARLLIETDASVTEICYACGYRNLSHFLRSFSHQYGISPKRYRNAHLSEK